GREPIATRRRELKNRRVTGQSAGEAGLIDAVAPTLGDLIVALNGREVPTAAGPVRLSTAKQIDTKAGPRQTADQPVSFLKLGTFASVQHSLTSPSVAFLLLIVGLSLMVFEFFTIGIGLAGGGAERLLDPDRRSRLDDRRARRGPHRPRPGRRRDRPGCPLAGPDGPQPAGPGRWAHPGRSRRSPRSGGRTGGRRRRGVK